MGRCGVMNSSLGGVTLPRMRGQTYSRITWPLASTSPSADDRIFMAVLGPFCPERHSPRFRSRERQSGHAGDPVSSPLSLPCHVVLNCFAAECPVLSKLQVRCGRRRVKLVPGLSRGGLAGQGSVRRQNGTSGLSPQTSHHWEGRRTGLALCMGARCLVTALAGT